MENVNLTFNIRVHLLRTVDGIALRAKDLVALNRHYVLLDGMYNGDYCSFFARLWLPEPWIAATIHVGDIVSIELAETTFRITSVCRPIPDDNHTTSSTRKS